MLRQGSAADRELLAPGSFGLAYMLDVVGHLPPEVLTAAFADLTYWLKPGGRLVPHTFPTLGPQRIYRRLLRARGKLDAIHCNVPTQASIPSALEASGLVIERIWLGSDFAATSSVYQRMRPGGVKTAARIVFNDLLGSRPVEGLCALVGLAEYAAPTIYALCRNR